MNNLKDNSKKSLVYNNNKDNVLLNVPNFFHSSSHDELLVLTQKAQKITTAIYMVTDLLSLNDPLSLELKSKAVENLSYLYKVMTKTEAQRIEIISVLQTNMVAMQSYLDIFHKNGKLSDMNHQVLNGEITKLFDSLSLIHTKSLPYDRKKSYNQAVEEFSFSESFFETSFEDLKDKEKKETSVKDADKNLKDSNKEDEKKVVEQKNSSIKMRVKPETQTKKVQSETSFKGHSEAKTAVKKKPVKKLSRTVEAKELRHQNILKILKQKKDAKIGDLSALIQDCSPKTIQRDLQELVDAGMVTKEGERRWSTYNLAY